MFRISVSEIFGLLDTKWYDNPTSSGVSKYTANSGMSISYDSTEGAYKILKTSSSGFSSVTLNNYRFTNTVTIKADIKMTGTSTNHQCGIGLLYNNVAINGKICYYSPDSYYAISFVESTKTTYGSNEVSTAGLSIQKNVWYTVVIEYNSNSQTMTLYNGDTVIGTVTASKSVLDASSNELGIWNGFNTSNNNTYVKNIRVL